MSYLYAANLLKMQLVMCIPVKMNRMHSQMVFESPEELRKSRRDRNESEIWRKERRKRSQQN